MIWPFSKQQNPFAKPAPVITGKKPFVIPDVTEWLMDRAMDGQEALAAYMTLTIALQARPQNFLWQ